MQVVVNNPTYGEIVYNESFWTGKRTLKINGAEAKRLEGKNYAINDTMARLKGSYIGGVKLVIGVDEIEIVPSPKWYEILCALFLLVFVTVWGNSVALCSIVPLVGGVIGGAIAGVCAVLSIFLMKMTNNVGFKLLIWLGMFALTVLSCFIVALALITAMIV